MSTTVGTVALDLALQNKNFGKQLNNAVQKPIDGVSRGLKKLGVIAAGAFAVKGIYNFGKAAVRAAQQAEEGSARLAQVMRNTMNATQGQIDKMNEFIDRQQSIGVVGSDVTRQGAQELATYLSLTSSLENLIPVMNDMVAQQYGFNATAGSAVNIATMMGKVMDGQTGALSRYGYKFTEAQEQILKYGTEAQKAATLAEVISESVGGMNKALANTPTGQITQLRNNFSSLMATIGAGIQNILMPLVRMINVAIQRLMVLAKTFKAFTERITGIKSETAAGAISVGDLTDGIEDAGDEAGKTSKKFKSLIGGYDEINRLEKMDAGADIGGIGDINIPDFNMADDLEEQEKRINPVLDRIMNRAKELGGIFKKGLSAGIGDDFFDSLNRTRQHIGGIKSSLLDIATDTKVKTAFNGMLDNFAYAAGQIIGSSFSIGASIAENLTGGIDKYLNNNKGFIKRRLVGIFGNVGDFHRITGNLAQSVASIFEVFRTNDAKELTSNVMGIFSNTFLGITEMAARTGRDMIYAIATPIINNADKIKQALLNTIKPLSIVAGAANDFIKNTYEKLFDVYDSKVRPSIEGIVSGISSVFSTILDAYNNYVAPVLERWAVAFDNLVKEKVQPAVDALIDLFGDICELVDVLWSKYLAPFVNWVIDTIVPKLMPVLETIGNACIKIFGAIIDILKGVFTALSGLIQFLTGVFQGDWEKAWGGVKKIFEGIWKAIEGIVTGVWELIIGVVRISTEAVKSTISAFLDVTKKYFEIIWGAIVLTIKSAWEMIKAFFRNGGEYISKVIEIVGNFIALTFGRIKTDIVNGFNSAIDYIKSLPSQAVTWGKDIIMGMVNGIKSAIGNIKDAVKDIADTIRSFIHFTVPDEGPLTDYETYMPDMIEGLTSTLKKAAPMLYSQVEEIAGVMSRALQPDLSLGGFVRTGTPALALAGGGVAPVQQDDGLFDKLIKAIAELIDKLDTDEPDNNPYGGGGDIVIQLNLPGEVVEEHIITAEQQRELRSGGHR